MDTSGNDHAAPFDTALLKRRRAQGRCGPDFLLELAGEELLHRLQQARERLLPADAPPLRRIAVCGPAALARQVARALPAADVLQMHWLAPCHAAAKMPQLLADHEHLPFADAGLDVALVLFDFACVNDLPRALREWRRVLRPGGMLLAVLPGGETLHELRTAWMEAEERLAHERGRTNAAPGWRVAPFVELRQLAQLAGMAGFADVVTDTDRLRVRHADALALMQELKRAGWSNPLATRPHRPVSRHLLALAAAIHELRFSTADGRVTTTFELLYLSATRPPVAEGRPSPPAGRHEA